MSMDFIRLLQETIGRLLGYIFRFLRIKRIEDKVSKLQKVITKSEQECYKRNVNHENLHRIPLLQFNEKIAIADDFYINTKIVTFTKTMAKLTGLIYTSGGGGTCFLQKIRRLVDEAGNSTGRAVFTFTTAYHVFGAEDKLLLDWITYKTKVILFYDERIEDFFNEKKCPRLKECRLLDTDKEEGIENDWCAIECEVDCSKVFVTNNQEKNLVDTLESCLQIYKTQQKEIYELLTNNTIRKNLVIIVGHPHYRPKQVSVGRHYPSLKDEPKKVRSGQLWCRYYYDAPTCIGNSGSPVFIPGQPIAGFGYWFGHQHNHKRNVPENLFPDKYEIARKETPKLQFLGMSSIGVELC
ncbi:acidic repeat-containing protein-like isoform X2 [Biomphalaria pfeifferi]|uniref:Acidic repeat-containing protein-like isoform X2 n=1 Tax=Biomphalaria pfeifferi TaxID=112525 RepID=A0AAD8F184_BIOPF|nr:acidic repeat-containing protein-like isoform X2 [Biomphalaria pfeifferi]